MGCACDVARGKAALILCNLVAQNLGAGRCAPWLVTSREEGFNGNRNQQNSLSTMEHGKVEVGAEILLRISREFGKSIEWLLTG